MRGGGGAGGSEVVVVAAIIIIMTATKIFVVQYTPSGIYGSYSG